MLGTIIDDMQTVADRLSSCPLDDVEPRELLACMRALEVVRRRVDAGTDRLVDRCDTTAAYRADGHRSTKAATKHLGRLPGGEALARTQTVRALRVLPCVAAGYTAGVIPTAGMRAIARLVANPRVKPFLAVADPVFAEMASELAHDDLCDWLKQWEALADADGAGDTAERNHERRSASFGRNDIDGTWHGEFDVGDLQGVIIADIFDAFVQAELDADIAWAKAHHGPDFCLDQLPRTARQRRADALFAVFRRAMAQPADAKNPEPLVNIVIDDESLTIETQRACGETVTDDPERLVATRSEQDADERARPTSRPVCATVSGRRVHPSAALAALMVGYVRRIVIDSSSNVIDLGRRRRLFTGSSREAAHIQALVRDRGGTGCLWSGCDSPFRRLQVDHRQPYHRGGATDIANSGLYCGVHNRLKEHGFRPVFADDGAWTVVRPDGTPITPAA